MKRGAFIIKSSRSIKSSTKFITKLSFSVKSAIKKEGKLFFHNKKKISHFYANFFFFTKKLSVCDGDKAKVEEFSCCLLPTHIAEYPLRKLLIFSFSFIILLSYLFNTFSSSRAHSFIRLFMSSSEWKMKKWMDEKKKCEKRL